DRLPPGQLFEHIGHTAFQVQAVVKNEVGLIEPTDVPRRRLIKMRIDSFPHQRDDLNPLAADVPYQVGDHAGRTDDVNRSGAAEAGTVRTSRTRRAARRSIAADHGEPE